MKKSIIIVAAIVLLALGSGCAQFDAYMKDRALDLVDCFKADIGLGLGLDAHVIVTDAISGGAGFSATGRVGFKGRYPGVWVDAHMGFPFPSIALLLGGDHIMMIIEQDKPFVTDALITGLVEYEEFQPGSVVCRSIVLVTDYLERARPDGRRFSAGFENLVNAFDVEVSATYIFIGARLGFSFGQFADFLLGWFGVDIAGDDTPSIARKIQKLGKELRDEDAGVRRRAAEELRWIRDSRAVELLIHGLDSGDGEVREIVAKGLGWIGDPNAVPSLIKALEDNDGEVREQAARALGEIRDNKALDALIDALQDKHPCVPGAAAWALKRIGDKRAIGPLIEILKNEKERWYIARVLKELTSQDFGEDYAAWKAWYEENKEK